MEMIDAAVWQRPRPPSSGKVKQKVAEIIAAIQKEGDAAIRDYSLRFDGFEPRILPLLPWEEYPLDAELRGHLQMAAERIRKFCEFQKAPYRDQSFEDAYGRYGQRVNPVDSMAAYIPGGRFPLVSSALMTLLPAQVAGVAERVAVSPGNHPAVLAAASLAGATRFFHLGGAQAVAAVALGSSFQAAVDMVVGPGNIYVNTAKALLQDRVRIDTLAGPSEILILCDGTAPVSWLAWDVLAQAEHDPMALSVIAATDRSVLERVDAAVRDICKRFPERNTGIIQGVYCRDRAAMIAFANKMAPEHLHLACRPDAVPIPRLRHYGSLFVGGHSAVALGDYCTGPNHTLPTLGFARQKAGLHVGDFLKVATFQEIKPAGFPALAPTAMALAQTEGLTFHRESLRARMPDPTG